MLEDLEPLAQQALRQAFALDDDRRAAILGTLHDWVTANLVIHPDSIEDPQTRARMLAQIERFNNSLNALCAEGGMEIVPNADGTLQIVPGNGEAETTLILLRRGGNWFEGCHDVEQLIASAIF